MNRTTFAILMVSIASIALIAMWLAWRARSGRDAGAAATDATLSGEVVAEFSRASYVSTTPAGSPFERVAIPGLRFKGFADVTVRRDGVTVAVTGEEPVRIESARVLGTDAASSRVGKAVEPGGLALLRWRSSLASDEGRELESAFRFASQAEQELFAEAIAEIVDPARTSADSPMSVASKTMNTHRTTQEDA